MVGWLVGAVTPADLTTNLAQDTHAAHFKLTANLARLAHLQLYDHNAFHSADRAKQTQYPPNDASFACNRGKLPE